MAIEDDEDEFLYGSSEPSPKKLKTDSNADNSVTTSLNETKSAEVRRELSEKPASDEESEYEDDEDDDDSIEFIIDTKPGERAEAPQRQGPYSKVTVSGTNAPEEGSSTVNNASTTTSTVTRPGLDIEAVGEYEGKPINEIPLDTFEDKPWRKPGADITDYFNYGFDEITWSAYCSKQDKLSDFNPQKVLAMMGMGPMEMAMMAAQAGPMMPPPGFPGPPGGFNDMMGMGMYGGEMPGFPGPGSGMGGDDGAYGGSNIQGVAGVISNPHPGGFNRMNGSENNTDLTGNNGGPAFFNNNNNQMRNVNNSGNMNNFQRNNNFGSNAMNLTNGNNMNFPMGPNFQQNNNGNINNNNGNNNWNRGNRGR